MDFDIVVGAEQLPAVTHAAVDIEVAEWMNPDKEWISLVQVGMRVNNKPTAFVFDGKEGSSLSILRPFLTDGRIAKAMHNAAFDARKLDKHWGIVTQNAFCTMSTARKAGHKKYSLAYLSETFLNFPLCKHLQNSDFGKRPLSEAQIRYAAKDAIATLLLFEQQTNPQRYFVKTPPPTLPFSDLSQALLAIVKQFPSRYGIPQIVANATSQRSGLFGYILDSHIGEAIPDEKEVLETIHWMIKNSMLHHQDNRLLA